MLFFVSKFGDIFAICIFRVCYEYWNLGWSGPMVAGGSQWFGSFSTFDLDRCNALQRREAPRFAGRFYKRHLAALFAVREKRGGDIVRMMFMHPPAIQHAKKEVIPDKLLIANNLGGGVKFTSLKIRRTQQYCGYVASTYNSYTQTR